MTDLADELTEADLAAMWVSRPSRSAGPVPWFASPFAGSPPDEADSPFATIPQSEPQLEVEIHEEPLMALEERMTSMAARSAVQTREWLRLVAEFNRRKGWVQWDWVQWGMRSMAHWWSWSWSWSVGPGVARDPGSEVICRIEHGPGLTAAAVRRWAGDAALVAWVSAAVGSGVRLELGCRTRRISVALRRALRFRDGGCRFPGCPWKRFLDAHRVVHWADGGASDLGDLLLLCQWRHRGVHEDGFVLRSVPDRPGRWVFHRPDGIPVLDAAASVPVSVGASERVFDSDGLRPGRYGEPFSLRDSVDVFCRNQLS